MGDAATNSVGCCTPSCMQEQLTPPPEAERTAPLAMGEGMLNRHASLRDWTEDLPQSDHVRFFRDTDWARTTLGPLQGWSPTLRLFVGMVFADSRAACLWWGSDFIAIYNEGFQCMAAGVHPTLMGRRYADSFPEIWPYISALFAESMRTGKGQNVSSGAPLLVDRNGYREEAYFSGSFNPIGPANSPLGFYNSVFEVTTQKLADRRTSMLNSLAALPMQTVHASFLHILTTLETNPNDVPMAMLYKFEQGDGEQAALRLQGQVGFPEGHPLIVDSAYIGSEQGLIPDLRRAGFEVMVMNFDERFNSLSWSGYGVPSKKIAILPITSGSRLFGYLVVGTNPYRPHDDMCEQFVRDLHRIVSSIVSAAVESEFSKRRQEQLEADLAFSDLKLRHLIEHASVGMCHISVDGCMLWANDHYYRLSGKSAEEHIPQYSCFDAYMEEDRAKALETFESLLAGIDHVAVELRLKRMYVSPNGEIAPAQLLVLAFPYRDPETGQVMSIMACTTDISKLKWAQSYEARQAAEAREAKRQQKAFIDVVSHEMRNPLSAIVHCADAIATTVEECEARTTEIPALYLEALNDNVQSAKIILQCAHHQKRIIDDVLTLSKLDSMLLSITPVAVKPSKLINSVVSIFEIEMKSNKICYEIIPDASIMQLAVDRVYLDPSRVTQVFINLLTNAIKFVKSSKAPSITIRFGACRANPRDCFPGNIFWATKTQQNGDVTNTTEWGSGEELYLIFSVKDSGIGLREVEIAKIFERFKQANVKTHVKYGGSGLGLFISKQLTEKQGGEIGVSSVEGEGATFGFYIKSRRVEREPDTVTKLLESNSMQATDHQQLRVLLVEDNIINQQVLSRQLKKAGCMVDIANHGLEALSLLEEKTFDVVLMDSEMPVMDGISATRSIRHKELAGEGLLGQTIKSGKQGGIRLPIIAVTANVRQSQVDTALAAGADRVMQKPFKARELVQMMQSLLPQVATLSAEPSILGLPDQSNGLIP